MNHSSVSLCTSISWVVNFQLDFGLVELSFAPFPCTVYYISTERVLDGVSTLMMEGIFSFDN